MSDIIARALAIKAMSSNSVYTLELNRWGVSNIVTTNTDTTLSTNNSRGINNALNWASTQGYSQVVLPMGTYLIAPQLPLEPPSFMTLNLNGSTLQIQTNALASYSAVSFQKSQRFSRVTNGTIIGDKDTHNYYVAGTAIWQANHNYIVGEYVIPIGTTFDSSAYYFRCTMGGTSGQTEPNWNKFTGAITNDNNVSWEAIARVDHYGYGVVVGGFTPPNGTGANTRYISIDNLEIYGMTGDSIGLQGTYGQIQWTNGANNNVNPVFEQGTIGTTDGTLLTSSTRIRSTSTIPLTNPSIVKWGYFGLYGDSFGNLGAGITASTYDVIFYNSDNSFNSAATNIQFFDEVIVPNAANYAKIVLHQSYIPPKNVNFIQLRVPEIPKYTYIEKCDFHDCRRLGLSVTGAKHAYITGCEIHHIKGLNPQGAIDIEDGYKINQYIYFLYNNIHDSVSGITVAGAKFVTFSDNKISDNLTVWNGSEKVLINGNTFNQGNLDLMGSVIFEYNKTFGTTINLDLNGGTAPIAWTASSARKAGDIIVPSAGNGLYYYCINAGTSGTTEPIWSTVNGIQITDGTATWLVYGADKDIMIGNSYFENSQVTFNKYSPNKAKINDCKFFNNPNKINESSSMNSTMVFKLQPQIISNCIIEGDDYNYPFYIPNTSMLKGGWTFNNLKLINVTKLSGLPPGGYTNCDFQNASYITIGQAGLIDDYTFIDCKFTANFTNINTNLLALNNTKSVRMTNCLLQLKDGYAILIQNVTGEVILRENRITYPAATASRDIIQVQDSFTGTIIEIVGNTISSSKTPLSINNQIVTNSTARLIVANNILTGATLNLTGKEIKYNNIINNVVDPYYQITSAPTFGYYKLGQQLFNSSPVSSGYIGWVCTVEGMANGTPWSAGTAYTVGKQVNTGGNVYQCTSAGTSGNIAPAGTGSSITDGSVVWKFVNSLAVFKPFGLIS